MKYSLHRRKRQIAGLLTAVMVLGTVSPAFNATSVKASEQDVVTDESQTGVWPEQDTTYVYSFSASAANVIVPTSYDKNNRIDTLESQDGFLRMNGNNQMYHNGDNHGLVVADGNSFEIKVAGNAVITFDTCKYGNGGNLSITGAEETGKLSKDSLTIKSAADGEKVEVSYGGEATTLKFTVNGSGYVHGVTVKNTSEEVDLKTWAKKDFSIHIGNDVLTVTGAAKKSDSASASLENGTVYYAKSENAYVSVDLENRNLKPSILKNLSTEEVENLDINENGDIVVTYKDQTTYPSSYTIKVQDSSAFETPAVTDSYSFNFGAGSIPAEFDAVSPIMDSYTTDNGIVTLAKGTGTNSPYMHDASHGLAIYDGNYFDVVVSGDSQITFTLCGYGAGGTVEVSGLAEDGTGSFDSDSLKGSVCNDKITYTYTGSKTTLRFAVKNSGMAYLHGMTVKNTGTIQASEVKNEQAEMPVLSGNTEDGSVTAFGQKLYTANTDTNSGIITLNGVSYYLFDASTEAAAIEADIKINSIGGSSSNGIFVGMFEEAEEIKNIATIGIRGDKKVRNVYNKSSNAEVPAAGGINVAYSTDNILHVAVRKNAKGFYTEVTEKNVTTGQEIKYSSTGFLTLDSNVQYGIAFSNVNAVITNLKYTAVDGTVLYDQNDCYEALGTLPVVADVDAPVVSEDRTEVSVSWEGTSCKDDAAYKVELSTDGGETFTTLSSVVTKKSYTAQVTADGDYVFRISGILGNETSEAKVSEAVTIMAPLAGTVIAAESKDGAIELSWTEVEGATAYQIYRKSSEESAFTMHAEVSEVAFEDVVENEVPYYYYVTAVNEINTSNPSNIVLSLATAGHVGEYAYGEEAAQITITEKSNDTVFTDTMTIAGKVDRVGTIVLDVNGEIAASKAIKYNGQGNAKGNGKFSFTASLLEGRNDVNLYFTDTEGIVTRQTYNFVYLTNYDMVVDGSYEGENGDALFTDSDVKVYKTVQAAVNSVASNNKDRVTILIKEGSYDEHLVVASPYITMIGEDSKKVNINFYDSVLSPEGGDTEKRCSVYVKASAKGFTAENLTFENTYDYLGDGSKSNESADALRVDADSSVFVNVRMLGFQDTLNASANHQYYYKCYIMGNIDYIYGSALALFEDCDLVYRYSAKKNAGYIAAPKTNAADSYGYIFNNCRVLAESECSGSKYLLARPWGQDGAVTFMNTYMSGIVNTATPYADMSGNLYTLARFQEYFTYGEGFTINNNRTQISTAQAEAMLTVESLGWNPYSALTSLSEDGYVGK